MQQLFNPRPANFGLAEAWPPRFKLGRVEAEVVANLKQTAEERAALEAAVAELEAARAEIDGCEPSALKDRLRQAAIKAQKTGDMREVHETGRLLGAAEETKAAVELAVEPRIRAAHKTLEEAGLAVLDQVERTFSAWAKEYESLTRKARELFDNEEDTDEWLQARVAATRDQLEAERRGMANGGGIPRLRSWGLLAPPKPEP